VRCVAKCFAAPEVSHRLASRHGPSHGWHAEILNHMDLPQKLDPRDWSLLKTIMDALKSRADQDVSVAEDFGKGLTGEVKYAAFACWLTGIWRAEILLVHGAPGPCGDIARQREADTEIRQPPEAGTPYCGRLDVCVEAGLGGDWLSFDLPEPRI